ncbi:MAG: hypothetical protein KDK96_11810 [Chlamydiia bacterium]|nr:hypothetical protein [Chlamydiia bacterium]
MRAFTAFLELRFRHSVKMNSVNVYLLLSVIFF